VWTLSTAMRVSDMELPLSQRFPRESDYMGRSDGAGMA
jgi:hypothetical protein